MPRPEKCRRICSNPRVRAFAPVGRAPESEVIMGFDEYEAVRLIDGLNHDQAACAQKMGVSRATVARIHASALRKLADALVGGRALRIEGGDVIVCAQLRPECANEPFCCHRGGAGCALDTGRAKETEEPA